MKTNRPKIGVGIIIVNDKGQILIGKRKGSHNPYYSVPGGHLEIGETFESCAIKEAKEETGLDILNPKVICITNNLHPAEKLEDHSVSVGVLVTTFTGQPMPMEPNKCDAWFWVDPSNLPEPHFSASRYSIECYLKGLFYTPTPTTSEIKP